MKLFFCFLIFLETMLSVACAQTNSVINFPTFTNNLSIIRKDIDDDLTAFTDLLRSKEFRDIYNNPSPWFGFVKPALESSSVTANEKFIVVLSMQKLPLKTYLEFIDQVRPLAEKKVIPQRLWEVTWFPGHDWNKSLELHYKKTEVRKVLLQIKASPATSESYKGTVDYILSGEAARNLKKDPTLLEH